MIVYHGGLRPKLNNIAIKQHFQPSMLNSLIIWDNYTLTITGTDREPSIYDNMISDGVCFAKFGNFYHFGQMLFKFLDFLLETHGDPFRVMAVGSTMI